jgi:hypothetical protein
MDTVKRPGNKGTYHEHFIFAGKRRVDPQCRRSGEPEPGVISGVPDHDHNPVPQLAAGPEPFLNKARTHTLALMLLTYGKRCKSNSRYVGMIGFNRYWDKEYMPDNLVFIHGNEREPGDIISIISEGADKPGFTVLAECLKIDSKNCGNISRNFRSDKKRIHPVL